jgi:hypothetical protein
MAMVAGVATIYTFFNHPGYAQLRRALEHAPISSWIGGHFRHFANLRGVDVPLEPVSNLWDLISRLQKLLNATDHARWSDGRPFVLDDIVRVFPNVHGYIIRRLENVSHQSDVLAKSIDILLHNLEWISDMRDGPRFVDGVLDSP